MDWSEFEVNTTAVHEASAAGEGHIVKAEANTAGTEGRLMACPERELLESEVKQTIKRWMELEDKAAAAIRDADPHFNEFLAPR